MFDKSSGATRQKSAADVTVTLSDGISFDGAVFLNTDQRLIDLLNDQRAFIPIRRDDGHTIIVSKGNIVSIIEIETEPEEEEEAETAAEEKEDKTKAESEEPARPRTKAFNPFEILRIPEDAPLEKIREAYRARLKAVHPDNFAGADLDEDLARASLVATQKVNIAYQRILKDHQQAEAQAEENAA